MRISIFKSVKDVNNPFHKSLDVALNRIRNGNSKEVIEAIRNGNKDLKESLPGYCFSGEFKSRSKKGLINHSGLMVLDYDHVPDAEAFKKELSENDFILSAFISPSGDGVKALVRIPQDPDNQEGYFQTFFDNFNSQYLDESGKDVSRFCFESYDPELYYNDIALTWSELPETEAPLQEDVDVILPLTSEATIIQKLQTWFDKNCNFGEGSRNQSIFKFACALSDFGVMQSTTESYLQQYAQPDFNENEILKVIKSAYRKCSPNFGTKYFEDKQKVYQIKGMIRSGKSIPDISKKFPINDVEIIVDELKDSITVSEFWEYTKKNLIRIVHNKFKYFLEQNRYIKYHPNPDSPAFHFARVTESKVDFASEVAIKDFVLNYLMDKDDLRAYDMMAANTKFFKQDYLSMIKSVDIQIKSDTQDKSYLYFQNCVIEVSKEGTRQIDYIDLDGYVWKNQIIDRDYTGQDHHKSQFRSFIWYVAGQDSDRYNSIKSVIGYLLHSYKTSSRNKAIILNDETISENPNGGSGKGLFWNALSKMKKVSMIDGKTFDFGKSFPYQTVSTDCQVLVFDDVKKNFNFESLFSVITEGITIEYKGKDAVKIPVEKSPKILITTNYTVGGVGGSFDRRKFEVEFSSYFGAHHSPEEQFGNMLFDDWDSNEWARFDSYMIECLKYYLENGLVAHEYVNLKTRKFIKATSSEFFEWSKDESNIPLNSRQSKKEIFNRLIEDYPDLRKWLSQKRFKMWLELFAKEYGYQYTDGVTNGNRWFEIEKENPNKIIEEDEGYF